MRSQNNTVIYVTGSCTSRDNCVIWVFFLEIVVAVTLAMGSSKKKKYWKQRDVQVISKAKKGPNLENAARATPTNEREVWTGSRSAAVECIRR